MSLRATLAVLTLAVSTFLAAPAVAQDAENIEKIQQHFDKGAEYYATGQYQAAIDEFEQGYALYPDPIFLYNIALAHGKLGRVDQSLAVAELAETMGLQEPDNSQNVARIVALRRIQSARIVGDDVDLHLEKKQPVAEAPGFFDQFSTIGIVGLGTAGAGTAALIGAFIVDLGMSGDVDAYEAAAARGDQAEYARLKDEVESSQTVGKVLFFGGVGLVAVGGGLVAWDLFSKGESTATATVVPTPGGAAASLQVRW